MSKNGIGDVDAAQQGEVARAFGLTPGAVRGWKCPRASDGSYRLADVIKWRVRSEVEAALRRVVPGDPDSLAMAAGGDSPALERWRTAKADLEEMKLAELRGETIRVKDLEPIHLAAARHIRGAGDKLQKQFGVEAWRVLDEALENCERELLALPEQDTQAGAQATNGGAAV